MGFWRELLATHAVVFLGANVRGGYVGAFLREAASTRNVKGCYLPIGPWDTEETAKLLFQEHGVESVMCAEADSIKHPADVLLHRLIECSSLEGQASLDK